MSLAKPELEYQYTYEDGMWNFNYDNRQKKSKEIGIIYDVGPVSDMLLNHGSWEDIAKRYSELNKKYKEAGIDMDFDIRMTWVPPEERETLNKCIAISASRWCTTLEKNVKNMDNCIIITDENN